MNLTNEDFPRNPKPLRETEISRQFQQVESEISDLQALVRELRDNLVCVLSEEVEQTEKQYDVSSVTTEFGRRLEKMYGDTNITRNIVESILKRLEL